MPWTSYREILKLNFTRLFLVQHSGLAVPEWGSGADPPGISWSRWFWKSFSFLLMLYVAYK